MIKLLLPIAAILAAAPAYAGCIGAGLGEGCIGIPTPNSRPDYEERDSRPVIVERHHHHRHPVIIERHHDEEEE